MTKGVAELVQVREKMREIGRQPEVSVYTSLLRGFGAANNAEAVNDLFAEMKAASSNSFFLSYFFFRRFC